LHLTGASEIAMPRILPVLSVAILFALIGLPDKAAAQAGCQPTLTQPCAKPPAKTGNQPPARKSSAESDDANAPKDHSPRIKLDQDTDFKFGTGGLGLQRKF